MRKIPRLLKVLPVVVLALVLLTTAAMAADETFDTENFVGLVLKNTEPSTVTVKLYGGFVNPSTTTSSPKTPVYTETVDGVAYSYYEVAAGSKYTCVAKPASGYARYNDLYSIYISAEEATQKLVKDVTPATRTTNGWDPSGEIRHYTDETLENIYPSSPDLWPQYADFFTTPAFGRAGSGVPSHKQTTQTEMMNFLNGLNMANDDMYMYILGQSGGTAYDIPLVIFTKTDLSSATTLEEAAALVNANGKLTVHYQAQIHGNEPAAGEAALGMIQRLTGDYGQDLMENMNIYVIPRLSPYGAYKSQRGVYLTSSTTTDPNRDFLRLWTKETQLRMEAYNLFKPEVVLDGHEFQVASTATKVQKRDLMLCTHFLPTHQEDYKQTALALADAAFTQLGNDGLGYSWYSDSVNGIGGNTGSSNTAFRASFHILMETDGIYRGLQNYERRVASHASAMTGIFSYLDENAADVKAVVKAQRDLNIENGKTYREDDIIILDGKGADDESLHITGQWISLDSGTVYSDNSSFEASVSSIIARSRIAPTAYVIPAGESWTEKVLDRLDKQGITYDFIPEGAKVNLQQYTLTTLSSKGNCTEAGLTDEQVVTFPNGAYACTMDQHNAYILAFMMEPDVNDAYNSDLEQYQGTFVYDKVIPTPAELGETFPIYRYIRDLNAKGEIDYAATAKAPEGLSAVGATKIGGTGKITGLDAAKLYEYRSESQGSYTAVAAGAAEIADLPVGKYYVRFAATATTEASADALVEVIYGVLEEYVVYLDSTNGTSTNDGYTEATPVNTIDRAYSQLTALMASAPAGTTGKVVIVGTYNVSGSRVLPKHDFPVLVTGGTLKLTPASDDSYPYLGIGGETTFDQITLIASKSAYLCGEGNKLVIGANVTTGTSNLYNVCGGGHYRTDATIYSTDVTVRSGTWSTAYAGGYTIKTNGDARLVLENCKVSRVTNSFNASTTGNVYYSLKNVTITYGIYGGNTGSNHVNGNVTLVLGENVVVPEIYAGSRDKGNVGGTVTVIADGIDLNTHVINGKAKNTNSTVGGLKLVVNKGELADVAESFITKDGTEVILGCDQTKTATIPYSINLDLNGCNGNIAVADGKTATVCDTATDDFKVLDEQGYGILAATGTVVAKEGYDVRQEVGGTSYHRWEYALDNVSLRPAAAGIYYTGQFGLNELYRENVECYGVVLSLKEDPQLGKDGCVWSELTAWPETGAGYGTVLTGIMTKDGGYTTNRRNADMVVYGVAYIKYTDGTVEYSNHASFTLKQVVEASDAMWSDLTDTQKNGLLDMYADFSNVMKAWNIPNIKANA